MAWSHAFQEIRFHQVFLLLEYSGKLLMEFFSPHVPSVLLVTHIDLMTQKFRKLMPLNSLSTQYFVTSFWGLSLFFLKLKTLYIYILRLLCTLLLISFFTWPVITLKHLGTSQVKPHLDQLQVVLRGPTVRRVSFLTYIQTALPNYYPQTKMLLLSTVLYKASAV